MNNRDKIFITNPAAGFSLVEIMVSLVISLFILGGAVTILMQNQQNYRQNDDFGRIQENARFALDLITSDLRMAGFWGCSNKRNNQVAGAVLGDGSLLDTTFALDGMEQDTNVWKAQGSIEIAAQILPRTDAITIRKLRNAGVPVSLSLGSALDIITVQADASPVQTGELAAIYNCERTDIFRASAADSTTIQHGAGDNVDSRFSQAYPQNDAHSADPAADPDGLKAQTFVAAFDAVRYYISRNDPIPTLWRQYHDGTQVTQQPVVEGIEQMQILYGENTAVGGEPEDFKGADEVTNWDRVVAVKITLLIRSVEESPTQEIDDETYDIYGTPAEGDDIEPGGRYTRKLVSAVVMLRNQQVKLES